MKKLLFILVLTICMFSLGAVNTAKMYTYEDDISFRVRQLCIRSGVLYPSAYPVSGEELLKALDTISSDYRDSEFDTLYNEILSPFVLYGDQTAAADLSAEVNFSAYIHDGKVPSYLLPDYRDIPPMAALTGEAGFSNTFYFVLEFMEKDSICSFPVKTNWSTLLDNRSSGFTQSYQPFRVGMNAGNSYFSFQIGRNRQSFGRGITGNMMVGDNFSYQEYMKFSVFSSFLKYNLSITHFDNQTGPETFDEFRLNGMHSLRVVHDAALSYGDFIEFRVYLGASFESDNALDWRLLTPFNIIHSFNNFSEDAAVKPGDEANNIMGVELTWMMAPGWKTDIQVVMDQLQLKYESTDSVPNAFGFLFNIENSTRLGNGNITSYFEAAITQPWLYLNWKYNEGDGRKIPNYNYDHVFGYGISGGSEIGYSGYMYGPDTLVLSAGAEYRASNWKAALSLLYYVHGDHGIGSSNPTLEHYSGDNTFLAPVKDQLLFVTLSGEYTLNRFVKFSGKFSQTFIDSMETMLSLGITLSV